MYARIWTAQVSALRSTVCIEFRTPPSVLPLMEGGGGSGMEFHYSGPPIYTWHEYTGPKSSPPAMCPFRPVTSASTPPSIRCLLSPYHFHESTPFPPASPSPYWHLQHPRQACHIFHLSSREPFGWSRWPLEKTSTSPKGRVDQNRS
jgi:hypothetical protein